MAGARGHFVTDVLDYDGGRRVTAYVPPDQPGAVVYAGDGETIAPWGPLLDAARAVPIAVVGVHRSVDDTRRMQEYSPGFDPDRFAAHESFFVDRVRCWVTERLGVAAPPERTAVHGVSAGGELALALALRHPDRYGTVLCASPGAGYRPPATLPSVLPRAYFVAGTEEPFFRENATRWADALRAAEAEVVMQVRPGDHGDAFWRAEFAAMVEFAFRR